MNGDTFDALVIGGGINGLSALYHLKRLGAERVGLVERFSIGHDRGSSHGAARVTRSAYVAPEYVRLMQWVHAEEWPRIEKAVGKQLVYSNPGIYTGVPCERLDRYINAVQQVGRGRGTHLCGRSAGALPPIHVRRAPKAPCWTIRAVSSRPKKPSTHSQALPARTG